MTDAMADPEAETVHCADCGEAVELRRMNNGWLKAGCGCDESSVRVDTVLPDGWQP